MQTQDQSTKSNGVARKAGRGSRKSGSVSATPRAEPSPEKPLNEAETVARSEGESPNSPSARPVPGAGSRPAVKLEGRGGAVSNAMADIEKAFGKGAVMRLGEGPVADIESLPTGSFFLDRALGTGGYPRGRIVEVFGPESSGKTTLTLHAIAEVQRAGGTAAFIDAEHAFDARYARAIGVQTNRLLVSQPDYGEQALEIAQLLAKNEAVDLIVIDSVAALVPKAEIDGEMGDSHMGLQARLMSQALRKLTSISSKANTTFIFINQLRQKIGVVFGNPETTTGGNALKFYASVRLDVRRIGKVLAGENAVGNRTRVKVVKNKCAQPFMEAEFDIRWGSGIDQAAELLEHATTEGVIKRNGAHYVFGSTAIGHGREKARTGLAESADLRLEVLSALHLLEEKMRRGVA